MDCSSSCKPRLAVVVLNYNSANDCRVCVSYLRKQQGVELEIIIVDNHSCQAEQEKAEALCKETGCTFIPNDVNSGYNAGNNVGLRYAIEKGYGYVAIANPDMLFPDTQYFKKLTQVLDNDDRIAVAGSDIRNAEGIHQNPRNYPPSSWLKSFDWIKECVKKKNSSVPAWVANPNHTGYCDGLNGCCIVLRSNFLRTVGFFDEGVFLYGEEPILAAQVRQCGMCMHYSAEFSAIHNHRKNKEPSYWKTTRHWRHSQLYSIKKYSNYPYFGKLVAYTAIIMKFIVLDINHICKETIGKKKIIVFKPYKSFMRVHRDFINTYKVYGFAYAFYVYIWWINFFFRTKFSWQLTSWALSKKTVWLENYFSSNYMPIINKITSTLNKNNNERNKNSSSRRIWVFWGQGESVMPPLVKACFQQLIKYNECVTLVTRDNFKNFVDISDIILKRVDEGILPWAHFSDILRNLLLSKYGGLWLDSTVWVSGRIPWERFETLAMYTANGIVSHTSKSVAFWTSGELNWSSWAIYAAYPNYPLFTFTAELLVAIACREGLFPDYVLQDFLYFWCASTNSRVKSDLLRCRNIPCDNRNALAEIMNERYHEKIYQNLTENDFLFKLSFKNTWNTSTSKGEKTFYGFIIQGK